jgi:NAD(P)-dependent dehydrogenase (short-subunit alcohol dehydrogenase family)
MDGKVVLVTGANGGIGRETARALASLGATVVLAVRDVARGREAEEDIHAVLPGARLEVARVDLADLEDVRRFARDFVASHDRLDVLVNNAGFHVARFGRTKQGFESTFGVNHLAHFVLARELLPLLTRSAPSRVVTVASDAHRGARVDWDDLQLERSWSGLRAYSNSKLFNVWFSNELARRLEGTGVTSNALHPGSVRTQWGRGHDSGVFRWGVKLATPFLISPARGADTSVWLAASPEAEGVTGRYFVRRRETRPSRLAQDEAQARRLWEVSERLAQGR